jgi:hypothetical protein
MVVATIIETGLRTQTRPASINYCLSGSFWSVYGPLREPPISLFLMWILEHTFKTNVTYNARVVVSSFCNYASLYLRYTLGAFALVSSSTCTTQLDYQVLTDTFIIIFKTKNRSLFHVDHKTPCAQTCSY